MVGAVIVVYKANPARLKQCYFQLKLGLDCVVVVFNENFNNIYRFIDTEDRLILGLNKGIAFASNSGVFFLKKRYNIDWVIFSDQDTVYKIDFFRSIYQAINSSSEYMVYIPDYIDEIANNRGRYVIRIKNRLHVSDKNINGDIYQGIASGMVWKVKLFTQIGGFREDLFIDWVDMEICWRLYSMNHRIGLLECGIFHELGDSNTRLLNRRVPIRSAMRYYYLIRNGIYLALRFNHGSVRVNLWYLRKVILQFGGYLVLSFFDYKKIRALSIGLIHGITGRLGSYDNI